MPDEPLAYLITWTCYGTWLHGDPRGSVDRVQNIPGQPFLSEDRPRRYRAVRRLQEDPIPLKADQRTALC